MNDNELLANSAKAAGKHLTLAGYIAIDGSDDERSRHPDYEWNPLYNPAQALELAVTLMLDIYIGRNCLVVERDDSIQVTEDFTQEMKYLAATCRAITRVAAEIGKSL